MTIEDLNQLEQIGYAIDNSATLAKVLAIAFAETSMEADAVMALGQLLQRLADEIAALAASQAE
jgi:hypothetical protein